METRIDLLKAASGYLADEGLANPLGESEIFLAHILNCRRTELYLNNLMVERKHLDYYWDLVTTRARGLPLQYLIGSTEFMGLEFKVKPGVFIPRPETEILVTAAWEVLSGKSAQPETDQPAILDLGTGCGNIAISLAKHLKNGLIFACDISEPALQLAQDNSRLNNAHINLVKSNLFNGFKEQNYFSLVISNPPYISAGEIPALPRELRYEPRGAYDGGSDGLSYYRRIVNAAPGYLRNGGRLCLEIGDNQADAVKEIIKKNGSFSLPGVLTDYNNLPRVIVARLTNPRKARRYS